MVVVTRAPEFVLTGPERAVLVEWSHQQTRLGVRARIVLACAEPGVVDARVARQVGVSEMTVGKVRARFAAPRLEGLPDGQRVGRPKLGLELSDDECEQLSRWARRAMSSQALALRCRISVVRGEGA